MIDGRTQLVGLIGWPIEHSLSPAMHNAAFSALGLNWKYVPLPVRPGKLGKAIDGLLAIGFHGANVTIPYKQAVIAFMDRLSHEAEEIGAVNTIVVQSDGSLIGHNTDSSGFIAALRSSNFDPLGKKVIVIGAGGAARSAVHALLTSGVGRMTVLSRTLDQAQNLISSFADARLHSGRLSSEAIIEQAQRADLLVNATPVGMWPHVDGSIWPRDVPIPEQLTIFDLVYNPVETHLLKQARTAGARAISGLQMLVLQGAAALELWTGKSAPIQVMRSALKEGGDR